MPIPTIEWYKNSVKMIDQAALPDKLKFIYCRDVKSLWNAIKNMNVRGAPAIGIAGALGVLLVSKNSRARTYSTFEKDIKKAVRYLKKSRPTAVNLSWALDRMQNKSLENKDKPLSRIKDLLKKEALLIIKEDKAICRKMGKNGASLIKNKDNILTHCNAGALATYDYGTALGVFYAAKSSGKSFSVYVDETRPRLQGARLTTWELKQNKIPFKLICDNMAATLMKQGKIDKIMTGADRIASNGDTANKIGTYSLAVLAKYHNIPLYIIAPSSTFDLTLKTGKDIPVEERSSKEITHIKGKKIAPSGIKVYNPAFDVTPHKLIKAIVTEKGIIKAPFDRNISKIL